MPATLTVMVEDDAAPWSFSDGSGYANDVVLAAFEAAGVRAKLEVVPYARCKNAVMQARCAACFSMGWMDEFKGILTFSAKPLFTFDADYYINAKRLAPVAKQGLAPGAIVGVVRGYEYPPSVYAQRDQGTLVLEESSSETQLLQKLAAGRLDAALVITNAVKRPQALLAKAGVSRQVKRAFRAGGLPCYIGFSLAHTQGPWAKARFDQGFAAIAKSGRLRAIEAKWSRAPR